MSVDIHPITLVLSLVALGAVVFLLRRFVRDASTWLRLAALVLLALVALDPRIGPPPPEPGDAGADVVFVIDRTTSMAAQDYHGDEPRMAGVAADVEAIVQSMPGARFAVVTSDNEARIAAPWTTDGQAIITLARTMGWREEGFGTGSDIAVAVPLLQGLLGEDAASRPTAARYLVYMGDGEQIAEQEPASFEPLRAHLTDARVFGYGTQEGGVMAMRVDTDELVTRGGVAQRSMIDQGRLQTIAQQLDGTYQHRTAPGGIEGWPAAPAVTTAAGQSGRGFGWWFAIAGALVIAADLAITARRARQAREA